MAATIATLPTQLQLTEDIPYMGISLEGITYFLDTHCGGASSVEGLTTSDVVEQYLKSVTRENSLSYAELPEAARFLGPPAVFVSHAWGQQFLDLVNALRSFEADQKREQEEKVRRSTSAPLSSTSAPSSLSADDNDDGNSSTTTPHTHAQQAPLYFWLDLLVNNQHKGPSRPFSWWRTVFRKNVEAIGHTVLVLDWRNPLPTKRAWCLWEAACTLRAIGGNDDDHDHDAEKQSKKEDRKMDFSSGAGAGSAEVASSSSSSITTPSTPSPSSPSSPSSQPPPIRLSIAMPPPAAAALPDTVANDLGKIVKALCSIDVSCAVAFHGTSCMNAEGICCEVVAGRRTECPNDATLIRAAIAASPGGFDVINTAIISMMRKWIAGLALKTLKSLPPAGRALHPLYTGYASLLIQMGRLIDAETMLRVAYETRLIMYGAIHEETAHALREWADLKMFLHTPTASVQFLDRYYETIVKLHGKYSPQGLEAGIVSGVAKLRLPKEHNIRDGQVLLEEIAALRRSAYEKQGATTAIPSNSLSTTNAGAILAETSYCIVLAAARRKQISSAVATAVFAAEGQRRAEVFGPSHPRTVEVFLDGATQLLDMKAWKEAEVFATRAWRNTRRVLGTSHHMALRALGIRARALSGLASSSSSSSELLRKEAIESFAEAITGLSDILGRQHITVATLEKEAASLDGSTVSQVPDDGVFASITDMDVVVRTNSTGNSAAASAAASTAVATSTLLSVLPQTGSLETDEAILVAADLLATLIPDVQVSEIRFIDGVFLCDRGATTTTTTTTTVSSTTTSAEAKAAEALLIPTLYVASLPSQKAFAYSGVVREVLIRDSLFATLGYPRTSAMSWYSRGCGGGGGGDNEDGNLLIFDRGVLLITNDDNDSNTKNTATTTIPILKQKMKRVRIRSHLTTIWPPDAEAYLAEHPLAIPLVSYGVVSDSLVATEGRRLLEARLAVDEGKTIGRRLPQPSPSASSSSSSPSSVDVNAEGNTLVISVDSGAATLTLDASKQRWGDELLIANIHLQHTFQAAYGFERAIRTFPFLFRLLGPACSDEGRDSTGARQEFLNGALVWDPTAPNVPAKGVHGIYARIWGPFVDLASI